MLLIAMGSLSTVILLILLLSNIRLRTNNRFLNDEINYLSLDNTKLMDEKIELIKANEKNLAKIENQQQIINEFERLRAESQQSTRAALFELGGELSKQLIELHKKETKESREFSEKQVKESAEKFNSEFEKIVGMVGSLNKEISQSKDTVDLIKNALLSPSGAGQLAEITLENLLKNSGLRRGIDFTIQHNIVNEAQNALRPDALVFLPGNNLMIIDAKASKFLIEEKEVSSNLARTMNRHLRSLSSKDYQSSVTEYIGKSKLSNVMTLMFLPAEQALEKLMEADHEFLEKAWKSNIFPVGPSGLMNILSMSRLQISQQLVSENNELIIEEVKKLLSSIATLTDYAIKIGSNIQTLASNYDKFAGSYNHNFLVKTKAIGKLGIGNTSKNTFGSLPRYQIISNKSDILEVESTSSSENNENTQEVKRLEKV